MGLEGGLGPGEGRWLVEVFGWRGRPRLLFLRVYATHSQELEGFEALARDDGDLLHFGEEADFVGRQPSWEREGHGCIMVCYIIACVCSFVQCKYNGGHSGVERACPAICALRQS